MSTHEYKYDVYLSFTGADRDLKNDIFARLRGLGYEPYDSDSYCMGQFRQNYMEALDQSRVYLLLLTDNLRNDPAISGKGTLSEVRKELSVACELEAKNQLNIVILCMSQFFRFADGFHDYNDTVGWLYYTHTRGFSMVYGDLNEAALLSDRAFDDIASRVATFIEKRAQGTPVISQAPKIEIASERIPCRDGFVGREGEIDAVLETFRSGKQIAVLSGLGGMGKTSLATEVAARCHRDGLLRCPQIVRVQELGGGRGALHTVVSSTSYTKEIYDSLAFLGEHDKYERKLKALADLPENVLLVVDNYNSLRAHDLHELSDKLSCKLLITTRVADIPPSERVGVIHLGSMDEENARALFSLRLEREVAREDFSPLYRFTGGHTITLCMIAKMLAVHGMSIDAMLTALKEDGDVGAKVEYSHNEYGDTDTVLGHLAKLYDMSGFGEEERRILRAMSILSDGTIRTDDLMRVLSLSYKNEILELSRLGWIEILRGDGERLYLHPILSHMAARLLSPTAEAVAPMIDHLLAEAYDADGSMTYADATVLSERLYYALRVLSASEGALDTALWDAYVKVDALLGDVEGTRARSAALAARLFDHSEAALVTSYADMRLIECDPTRLDLIAGYMDELETNADRYKWVMRALSLSVDALKGFPDSAARLGTILEKAVDAAILRYDDFALCDLYAYADGTSTIRSIDKKIEKYLRLNRRMEECNGALFILSHLYLSRRLARRSKKTMLEEGQHIVDIFGDGSRRRQMAYAVRHLLTVIKATRIGVDVDDIPEDDPLLFYALGVSAMANRLFYEGTLDARAYIEMAVNLHVYRIECGHTLASTAHVIRGVIETIDSFAVPKIKNELASLCEGDESDDVTVTSLSRLQVSTIINAFLGDDAAVEQSRRVREALMRIRPHGHSDLVYATLSYADNLARFGRCDEALALYCEAYNTLSAQSGVSAQLSTLARKILAATSVGESPEAYTALFENATADLDNTLYLYQETLCGYALTIVQAVKAHTIPEDHPLVADMLARLHLAVKGRRKLSLGAVHQLITTLHNVGVHATSAGADSIYTEVSDLLALFTRGMPRRIRANAIVQKTELDVGRLSMRGSIQEKSAHLLRIIDECVKYGLQIAYASTKTYYILLPMQKTPEIATDTKKQLKLLGLSGRKLDGLLAECRAVKDEIFAPNVKDLDALNDDGRERVLSTILARELAIHAKKLHGEYFGIGMRDFRRMKKAQDFTATALRAVLASIRTYYATNPVLYRASPQT